MWHYRKILPVFVVLLMLPMAPAVAAGTPTGPIFSGGQAQPVFDPRNVVREDLYVDAHVDSDHDGQDAQIHVVVVRPEATEHGLRVPVVYQVSPYSVDMNSASAHNVDTDLYVPGRPEGDAPQPGSRSGYEDFLLARGYAVVYADSLGTGRSTGCPTIGGRGETIGARSVIDWLNSRTVARNYSGATVSARWSTGRVGMIGMSYDGTLANAVASTGVAGLKAIVPISAISNWYDYYRSSGAIVAPAGYEGEDADVLARYVNTGAHRARCEQLIDRMELEEDRSTGSYNRFWDERNYLGKAGNVHAAVLAVAGLSDWNVKTGQTAQWYAALRRRHVPHRIWWHRSGHIDPLSVRRDAWLRTVNLWFTRYLYDVPNGADRAPHAEIQRDDGSWTTEPEWPVPDSREVEYRLTAGGTTSGGLVRGPLADRTGMREELWDDARQRAEDLAAADTSTHRLRYFSEPVVRAQWLSGAPRVRLALDFDHPAANVTALLTDVGPDGSIRVVTRGWANPQHRFSPRTTAPVVPGQRYGINLTMQPADTVLPPGHRWGLIVLSSDHDFTLRPASGTRLGLHLDGSALWLPVRR
jgi:X-Pro dipeptidyl-peptidase